MTVFGTRPDTIKMAPVVHALQAHPDIVHRVCVTAQHRQMLDDLLEFFEIVPDYDLDVMTEDQTLTEITTRVLSGMEPVLADARPDVVLVHGDTTTSTAAALAAFYQQIPVGHVEAGLRTSNRWLPYPEEMNRRLTGTITSYHFSPTPLAREHLLVENVEPNDIVVTGNTVIDAFLETARRTGSRHAAALGRARSGTPDHRRHGAPTRKPSPHGRDLRGPSRDCELPLKPQIYWPVHPSPRVAPIARELLGEAPGIWLVEPIDYGEMVAAVKGATFVLTDSGGIQEEAPCLGKPVLVMRDETERPEGLVAGTLALVGHRRERIRRGCEPAAHRRRRL